MELALRKDGLTMTAIEQACKRTAEHETLHALYAVNCGMAVNWTRCRPSGETEFDLPMSIKNLYSHYTRHPVATIAKLRQIAGTVLAPFVILDRIPRGEHPMEYAVGPDRELLEQWGDRWELYRAWTQPAGPTWRAITVDAKYAIVSWYYDLGRRALIDMLADVLLERGMLDGHSWLRLIKYNISDHLKAQDKRRHGTIL
jgi:hypothetical protein